MLILFSFFLYNFIHFTLRKAYCPSVASSPPTTLLKLMGVFLSPYTVVKSVTPHVVPGIEVYALTSPRPPKIETNANFIFRVEFRVHNFNKLNTKKTAELFFKSCLVCAYMKRVYTFSTDSEDFQNLVFIVCFYLAV